MHACDQPAPVVDGEKKRVRRKKGEKKAASKKSPAKRVYRCAPDDPAMMALLEAVLYDDGFMFQVRGKPRLQDDKPAVGPDGQPIYHIEQLPCVAGHRWGSPDKGPRPSRVMVVGKWPGQDEVHFRQNLIGPSGRLLRELLEGVGLTTDDYGSWYVTNFIKHPSPRLSGNKIPVQWKNNFQFVLDQELALVAPTYLIALGSDATTAILGKRVSFTAAQGRCFAKEIVVRDRTAPDGRRTHIVTVMPVVHPAEVLHANDREVDLSRQLDDFCQLMRAGRIVEADKVPRRYTTVWYDHQLAAIVDKLIAEGGPAPVIAVDSEWHGNDLADDTGYLRCIQFCQRPGESYCVVLHRSGGGMGFCPSLDSAMPHLMRLFTPTEDRRPRIVGHNLKADLPRLSMWLTSELGELLSDLYRPAASPEEMRTSGGLDTMIAAHACREVGFGTQGTYKLEVVCESALGMTRWDDALIAWKDENKDKWIDGYGHVPDDVLHPYACGDADGTLRLAWRLLGLDGMTAYLDSDNHRLPNWKACWTAMRSAHAFLEIERTGVHIDKATVTALTHVYMAKVEELTASLREIARWPTFNPASPYDCRELLFGERYRGNDKFRPDGALSLNLRPIKTTTKPSKSWDSVARRNEEHLYAASTDKEVLGMLSGTHPIVRVLRNQKFVNQVVKFFLRPPVVDSEGEEVLDEDGDLIYESGLLHFVCKDGRVHPQFFGTTKTGRQRCSSPNCQNVSSKREDDYRKILGSDYSLPLRAAFTATPTAPGEDPWVLVDFDLQGAELFIMAVQSGDAAMLDACKRNMLPENHPDYLDFLSNMAVKAFRLDCAPTKKALAAAGKKGVRTSAKNLVYGLAYGRGDEAVLRAVEEEGDVATLEEIAMVRAFLFEQFPRLMAYFEACRARVMDPGHITNCFGRRRRALRPRDEVLLAELEREFMNFPIQATVADVVNEWLHHLELHPERYDDAGVSRYRICLQVHDSAIVECRVSFLVRFVEIVKECLSRIVVRRCDLDGRPVDDVCHKMATSIDVFRQWGVPLKPDEGIRLGIPASFYATA